MQLLLCYDSEFSKIVFTSLSILISDEGVYVNTYGRMTKNVVLQWGEMPSSVAYISTGQIMGWGNKAIEIRSVDTGHLDGVFMHKKAQKLKFLCERNDKVSFFNILSLRRLLKLFRSYDFFENSIYVPHNDSAYQN